MKSYLAILTAVIFLSACNFKPKADTLFYNGKVVTMNAQMQITEAFAVKDGKILETGSTKDLMEKYASKEKIDLLQKYVYPGFIDAHCHFMGYAGDLYKCQLRGTITFEKVLERVAIYNQRVNPSFIYGRGWDQNEWPKKEFPTNERLNTFFGDKPVFLKRIDGHAALVNQKFLDMAAEVLKPFENTPYIITKNGVPTGLILDKAMEAAEKLIPELPASQMVAEVMKAQEECFKLGITSLCDAGLSPKQIMFIDSLQKAGQLKMRIYAMVSASKENLEFFNSKGKIKTPYLDVRSLKVYADGALGSRGARLKKEYSDQPGNFGTMLIAPTELEEYAAWAIQHEFQLNTHAIGDSANAFILSVYANYLKGKNDLRWRIEHAQIVDPADFHYFGDYSIVPSVQPTHATSDMGWAKSRLGESRMPGAYAYRSLMKQNNWIPLGTDFPVEYLNPQYTFFAAVSRKDGMNRPKEGFNMTEGISREDALKGITIWAATANFEEAEKGSLEAGKYADFVIYDQNFLTDDLIQIRNSFPFKTFVSGQEVAHHQ